MFRTIVEAMSRRPARASARGAGAPVPRVRPALAVLATASVLALTACSTPAQAPASPEPSAAAPTAPSTPAPTPAPTQLPTPTPAPTPSPTPTPVPVLQGEAWIAFQWGAPCDPKPGKVDTICLVRPDGTGAHQLPMPAPGEAKHPDWSPDGAQVTFVLNDSIWVAAADGADARSVGTCDRDCDYPAWSPDGKRIAYTRYYGPPIADGPPSSSAIEIVDVASGEAAVVTRTERLQLVDQPRWSPDGDRLVVQLEQFKDDGSETGASIAILPVKAGSTPKAITDPKLFATYPDWNPTKDAIVFTTHDVDPSGGPVRLYTVRTDGSKLKELVYDGSDDVRSSHPSWTPDGLQVLFVQMDTRTAALVNADGTGLVLIDGISATHPRLRPTP